jgi:hypothetical protein
MAYSIYHRPARSARLTVLWALATSVILMILYVLVRMSDARAKTFATKLVTGEAVEKGTN